MTWAGTNIADDSALAIDVDQCGRVPIDASLRVAAPGRLSFRIGPEEPDRVPTTTGIGPERTSIFALHIVFF
jgi:hypothetical protein